MSGERWTKATDRAGSRSLRVIEGTAGTGPAVFLSAAEAQDLIEVGFLAWRLTDRTARCCTGI